jgi:alcohol dehydrogenase class IV
MPTAAIRRPEAGEKLLFWDDKLVPDATILDPEMAVYAGPRLSAATGMTAIARSIESLYSKHRHPISTALALHAARLLRLALPRSIEAPRDLAARADCQMACLMSGVAGINAMVSVVHAIGHVVGGRYGLQHGISHGILLAPALRRLLPAIGPDSTHVLEALGCHRAGTPDDAAAAMERLLAALPLPQRLREIGMAVTDIDDIAAATMRDYMIANVPAPVAKDDIAMLLRAGW